MSSNELTRRNRYKWSVNEILSLQREYELYELTIQEIALLHKRSVFSILHKLEKEQIIVNFNDARGYDKINFWDDEYHEEDELSNDKEDEQSDDKENDQNDQIDNDENEVSLSLQIPESDCDSSSDNSDNNYNDRNTVFFEDELMKKVQSVSNNIKKYENKAVIDIVYELIERIECLEDRLLAIESANSKSLFTFIKNWLYSKRIC